MYRKLCAAACVLASILIHTSIGKSDDSADMKELTRLEKVWNDAYVRADADALEQLCADDLVVTMTDMVVLNKQVRSRFCDPARSSFSVMKRRTSASTFTTMPLS